MSELKTKAWAAVVLSREPDGNIRVEVRASKDPIDVTLVRAADMLRDDFFKTIKSAVAEDSKGKVKHG